MKNMSAFKKELDGADFTKIPTKYLLSLKKTG